VSNELEQLKQRCERLSLLYQVSKVIHSTLEPQKALELILSEVVRLTQASSGSIVLINPNTGFLEIEASQGLPPNANELRLLVGEGITGWVAKTGQPARVGDIRLDSRYIMLRENVKSEMAVPLFVEEELRGVVNVDSERLNAFSETDQELLEELAAQATRVIHNTWLYEQIRSKARLFETLASVSRTINSPINLEDALKVITREACLLMQARMCSLLLLDDSGEWLDLKASYGAGAGYLNKPRLSASESLVGSVVRRKRPIQLDNVQASNRYQNVEMARQEGLVSVLSVPLIYSSRAIGALSVYTGVVHAFSNEEIRILSSLAELSAIAIEKARLYERVVDLEEHLRQNEKLSAIGLLAAEVAHEIRNPLTVIKMLFHSLYLRFPEGDMRSQDVSVISEKMELLNRIVEKVLDFARSTEPERVPTDLNRVVDDLGLLVRHKLRQHNINLIRESDPDLPLVLADAPQLSQAFLNLTLNAVEAMPHGGELHIRLRRLPRAQRAATHVIVEFQDTGDGMSAEQQKRAFTSLLNTTRSRGTGLGLAIVAKVVEAHHGKVTVRSAPGKGTTFRLMLPRGTTNA
jgi:signal transduction histidine kinase